MIDVLVTGAAGKMGALSAATIAAQDDLRLVALVDPRDGDGGEVPWFEDVGAALALTSPAAALEFSVPGAVYENARRPARGRRADRGRRHRPRRRRGRRTSRPGRGLRRRTRHRPQLRPRRRAAHEVRRRGGAPLRARRDHRDAREGQGRRAVRAPRCARRGSWPRRRDPPWRPRPAPARRRAAWSPTTA